MASSVPMLSISEDSSMAARQEAEVRAQKIIDHAWAQALENLERYKIAHGQLVAALLERETIDGAEIEAIIEPRSSPRSSSILAAE
jgi:ATP-dependent Zn protease